MLIFYQSALECDLNREVIVTEAHPIVLCLHKEFFSSLAKQRTPYQMLWYYTFYARNYFPKHYFAIRNPGHARQVAMNIPTKVKPRACAQIVHSTRLTDG